MQEIRIGFGQINPVIGDFSHNAKEIRRQMTLAAESCDLLVFGELALCGYPLGDLSYRDDIIAATEHELTKLVEFSAAKELANLTVVLGHVAKAETQPRIQSSYASAHNSATVFRGGEIIGRYDKQRLPNYDVFDDWRNFVPGDKELIFDIAGKRAAVAICEDIWEKDSKRPAAFRQAGVELLIVPNGSPYNRVRKQSRRDAARAFQDGYALAYSNLAGGQDDLVFDGGSFLLDASGKEVFRAHSKPGLVLESEPILPIVDNDPGDLFEALVTGVRDYCDKTGQSKIVLGLSGGIDSALCCAIACEAIGAENVLGVALPSRHSSDHSLADAEALAAAIGCEFRVEPINSAHDVLEEQLELEGLSAENVQSRIRAVILMAISNQDARLLLTTGNKSELAVGYSTIYGDSAGGFAPIKDVLKTDVWMLSRWYNQHKGEEIIPVSSIEKEPSAELRPDQIDKDSLPDYEVLDHVLHLLLEKGATVDEIEATGVERALISEIDEKVRRAEWKRSQGAIGPKTTTVSFGSGRRMPITTRFGRL